MTKFVISKKSRMLQCLREFQKVEHLVVNSITLTITKLAIFKGYIIIYAADLLFVQ